MNDIAARDILDRKIASDWNTTDGDIAWQGDEYQPNPEKAYIEVSFSVESTPVQSLGDEGNRAFIREGALHINVRVPIKAGDNYKAHTLAVKLRDMFEAKRFGHLWFTECKATPAGRDGTYNLAYANCTFQFQQIK